MPKRQSVKKVLSDEVQGEGSFVILKRFTVEEILAFRKDDVKAEKASKKRAAEAAKAKASDFEAVEVEESERDEAELEKAIKALKGRIVEWNWVDDDGNSLPQVKDNPDVLLQLTDEEVNFLFEKVVGGGETKN